MHPNVTGKHHYTIATLRNVVLSRRILAIALMALSIALPGANAGAATPSVPTWTAQPYITVGSDPRSIAVDPSGNVWLANIDGCTPSPMTVSNIAKGATTQTATVNVGTCPLGIASDPDGNIWVTNNSDGTVQEIPHGTLTASAPINVGGQPYGITSDPAGNIWIGNNYSGLNSIVKINKGANSVSLTVPVGQYPDHVQSDAQGNIWVFNSGDRTIQEIPVGHSTANPPITLPSMTRTVFVDSKGNIWFSYLVSGNRSVHPPTPDVFYLGKISSGSTTQSTTLVFPSTREISDIAEDHWGGLWLEADSGIFRLAPGSSTFTTMLADSNSYMQLAVDANDNVWVAVAQGTNGNSALEFTYSGPPLPTLSATGGNTRFLQGGILLVALGVGFILAGRRKKRSLFELPAPR